MALCPSCNAAIPLKLAVKSVDVLLFPGEGAERCPSCKTPLVPEKNSVVSAGFIWPALMIVFFVFTRYQIGGFNPGFFGGFICGLAISLGGMAVAAKTIRFDSL
ncbi:MAG: hypothetical protein M3N54_15090 [Acidobacteriota bacterium]|nr:hypothetical protein [Acidobacteriota bacterium]